jgi:hypothetical protein
LASRLTGTVKNGCERRSPVEPTDNFANAISAQQIAHAAARAHDP